ncbi:MAG: hypothetical protein ACI81Q_000132 [Paracoccaceae bacterium]|jgi:hypothetical protein
MTPQIRPYTLRTQPVHTLCIRRGACGGDVLALARGFEGSFLEQWVTE